MTERDRVASVLNSTEISQELSKEDIYKFADALIAAGIGDTTNLIVENKVLQRALLTTCVKLIEDEVDNVNAELLARVVYTKALRKAKKEVEEENNAEN